MKRVLLYIATTLDGFIARPDGNLDWLLSLPNPNRIDHGYTDFLSNIGTTIMGRSTYKEVIGFGGDWEYPGLRSYVVTRNKEYKISSPNTYLLTENIVEFVRDLKINADKDIWLIGGGQLITFFLNNELVDRMVLNMIPHILGDGIPLFPNKPKETNWSLVNAESFETGVINLTYDRKVIQGNTE